MLILAFLAVFIQPILAQPNPRALDPADIFLQAWLVIRDAEKLEKKGQFNDARLKYQQAAKYYDLITRFHKNYKPHMVRNRVISTREAIANVEKKALEEIAKRNAKTKDLVESSPNSSSNQPPLSSSGYAKNNSKTNQNPTVNSYKDTIIRSQEYQLKKLQEDNKILQKRLLQLKQSSREKYQKERCNLQKQIADKDKEIHKIRIQLAKALASPKDGSNQSRERELQAKTNTDAIIREQQNQLNQLRKETKKLQKELSQLQKQKTQEAKKTQQKINRIIKAKDEKITTISKQLAQLKKQKISTIRQPSYEKIYKDPIIRAQKNQLAKLQRNNQNLRKQLNKLQKDKNILSQSSRKKLLKQLKIQNKEITRIRNLLAKAPLQSDLKALSKQNKRLSMEIAITALSLKGTKESLLKAKQMAKKYEEEASLAQKRAREIQKNMDIERHANNKVIKKLREELKTITKVLKTTRYELGKANNRIAQMQKSLNQAQTTIKELSEERDSLQVERDALANILKKNDSSGVRKLITENMRLGKALKETNDRLEYLNKKHNATQDELLNAKRDLAVAKTRILRYQKEQTLHNKRIQDLESQLRDAEAELANTGSNNNKTVNQEEIDVLKATIKRMIAAQERQKTAEKILWETYKKSNKVIPEIDKAFADIQKTKIKLTDEEKRLMVVRRPDQEFTSPERVSPAHAQAFDSAMKKRISDYEQLVKRFFSKGRYELARQILADMDEEFPGHFPTLCNRGVLELKTNHFNEAVNIFNEAITMRENNSYAHYMLGVAQYKNNNLDAARNSIQHSLDLKPNNAKAHFYLGNIAGAGHRYTQAEKHFKTAIQLDPTMGDAYFNLSILYLRQHKRKKALKAYKQALENGALADPKLEQKIIDPNYSPQKTIANSHLKTPPPTKQKTQSSTQTTQKKQNLIFDPTKGDAYLNLTVLYLRQHKRKKAIESYAQALQFGASHNPKLEKQLNWSSHPKVATQQKKSTHPSNPLKHIFSFFSEKKNKEKTKKYQTKSHLVLDPTKSEAYLNLTSLYLKQNKKTEANSAYKKAIHFGASRNKKLEKLLK